MLKAATIAITHYFLAVVVGLDGRRRGYAVIRTIRRLAADSGPLRTVIPTHRGQHSDDCGQFLMSV